MRDVDGKADSLATLAIAMPMADNVADQIATVHARGKLRLNIVPCADFDAFQIGIDGSVVPRLDQVLLLDQLGDLRTFNDGVEDAAKPAAVATAWRRSQPNQHRMGISSDDLAISVGRRVVTLVDDEQVGRWQLHAVGAHPP